MKSELCNRCGNELLTWFEVEDEECENCSGWEPESSSDEREFVKAVLNKDTEDAHPDSMFAMKYSDKF